MGEDDAREARELAVEMSMWLNDIDDTPMTGAGSDLIEWCRSARDVLERAGNQAEDGKPDD